MWTEHAFSRIDDGHQPKGWDAIYAIKDSNDMTNQRTHVLVYKKRKHIDFYKCSETTSICSSAFPTYRVVISKCPSLP